MTPSHLTAGAQGALDWESMHCLSCVLDPPVHTPRRRRQGRQGRTHNDSWCAARTVKKAQVQISRRALLQGECIEGRQHSDEQHGRTCHEVVTTCALLSPQTSQSNAVLLCLSGFTPAHPARITAFSNRLEPIHFYSLR